MTIPEIIDDIKSINRLLDPKGQAWADETKKEREEYENENRQMADRVSLEII